MTYCIKPIKQSLTKEIFFIRINKNEIYFLSIFRSLPMIDTFSYANTSKYDSEIRL